MEAHHINPHQSQPQYIEAVRTLIIPAPAPTVSTLNPRFYTHDILRMPSSSKSRWYLIGSAQYHAGSK
ncbi:predicted protein [Sclerotinia sclerotiorum 1980 UF-70]|uniref:Uncharacterized protein n=1 Tax=Sclerotinia sclerotiorum (strain ATCC 18683 / 1980 / Ss-1) TaxID=665079 RepID=A7EPT9_SCLS1|nr:predicted protein [Sclerotinia sclerotiorum 1980 UF-70]EDO04855.1 predicted protein [Sclerotinia sclerotiorum 1980 UF-70]